MLPGRGAVDADAGPSAGGGGGQPGGDYQPRREDSQHGYVGDGGVAFTPTVQNTFSHGNGASMSESRTGGRQTAFMGEKVQKEGASAEDAAEEANEVAVARINMGDKAQQATLGRATAQDPAGAPGTGAMSYQNPETGEYDIMAPRGAEGGPPEFPPAEGQKKKVRGSGKGIKRRLIRR